MTQSTPTTALQQLAAALEEQDFPCVIPEKSKDNPVEQLFVGLGQDDAENPLVLQVIFINDIAEAMQMPEDADDLSLMQSFSLMPFKTTDATRGEMAELLFTINRLLPFGALGMSYKENSVYYSYVVPADKESFDVETFAEVISAMSMFLLQFIEMLSNVASGKNTCSEVVQNLEQQGITVPGISAPLE